MEIRERLKSIQEGEFFKFANLHCHSTYSDGTVEFDTLVEQAKTLGLKHFAITDHNTIEGYKASKYLDDPILIPSAEFDCFFQTTLLHVIGYGIDINNEKIKELCAKDKKETESDLVRLFKFRHPKDVIEAIHSAGGVAVFAHPCCSSVLSLSYFTEKLIEFGLDGMEVFYPYARHRGIIKFHSKQKALEIGIGKNLILTGGTDEHKSLIKH